MEKSVSVAPEQVIITKKSICGAVHGENIIVHNTAAMAMPTIGFLNLSIQSMDYMVFVTKKNELALQMRCKINENVLLFQCFQLLCTCADCRSAAQIMAIIPEGRVFIFQKSLTFTGGNITIGFMRYFVLRIALVAALFT